MNENASGEVEKDCLSPPRVVQIAEKDFSLLFGTPEVCICVDLIPKVHSHLPELGTERKRVANYKGVFNPLFIKRELEAGLQSSSLR